MVKCHVATQNSGTIKSVEYGEFEYAGTDRTSKGLIVEIEESDMLINYAGEMSDSGVIVPVSNAGEFLKALGELGYDTDKSEFDTDELIGKEFLFENREVGDGKWKRTIRNIPVEEVISEDTTFTNGDIPAETVEDTSKSTDDSKFTVYSAIENYPTEENGNCTKGKLVNLFIKKQSAYLIDGLDDILEDLVNKGKIKETKDGKLSVV